MTSKKHAGGHLRSHSWKVGGAVMPPPPPKGEGPLAAILIELFAKWMADGFQPWSAPKHPGLLEGLQFARWSEPGTVTLKGR